MSPRRLAAFLLTGLLALAVPPAGAEIFPLDPPLPVSGATGGYQSCPGLSAGQGGYAVTWESPSPFSGTIALNTRRFDLRGRPQGAVAKVGHPYPGVGCPALAAVREPGGRSLALWNLMDLSGGFASPQSRIVATPVAPDGTATGQHVVSPVVDAWRQVGIAAAALPDGRTLGVWRDLRFGEDRLLAHVLSPDGELLHGGDPDDDRFLVGGWSNPQALALASGLFLVAGETDDAFDAFGPLAGRLVNPEGRVLGDAFPIHDGPARVAALADGGFVAVWATAGSSVAFRLFDAAGRPRGAAVALDVIALPGALAGATVDAPDVTAVRAAPGGGDLLVLAWRERVVAGETVSANRLRSLAVESDGTPVGQPVRLDAERPTHGGPAVVSVPDVESAAPGTFLAAWSSGCADCTDGDLPDPVTLVRPMAFTPGPAATGAGDRFEVSVTWTAPDGSSGVGVPVELTDDTVSFWFFRPSNVELVVKVLDGRPVNGNFWVFGGALTTVEYTVTVHDTEADRTFTHHNPQGELSSFADTSAFPGS